MVSSANRPNGVQWFSGLVSITFRPLAPREIAALARQAGLAAIEWGGDVHVPHGNVAVAREVATLTAGEGLTVASYGSYYRVGAGDPAPVFGDVLRTAVALGAPVIRVWAGRKGSAEADAAYRQAVADDARRIAAEAAQEGIRVAFEFHGGTLTDTAESARELLTAVGHPNLRSYWQPPVGLSPEAACVGAALILPWLEHVHVFSWRQYERLPLAAGADAWQRYFQLLDTAGGRHGAMLEFVKDDVPTACLTDAAVLRGWLEALNRRD